jgi:hypothetical protein
MAGVWRTEVISIHSLMSSITWALSEFGKQRHGLARHAERADIAVCLGTGPERL